jgi:hypothetical protein
VILFRILTQLLWLLFIVYLIVATLTYPAP